MALSTQKISQVQVSRPRQLPFWLALIPICLIHSCSLLFNQQDSDRSTPPASTSRVEGALVIAGGAIGKQSEIFAEFIEFAGGAGSQIVVIPTASNRADRGDSASTIETWKNRGAAVVTVLHTRDREMADSDAFVAPLKKATGVWFSGGSQSRITDAYVGTAVERELHALIKRGGVIGGSSAGAAIMTKVMIAGGNPVARIAEGFGFLPGAITDQHFLRRNRVNRLLGALQDHPHLVGLGIDEGTAIVVTGSKVRVVGRSYVTVLVPQPGQQPVRVEILEDGEEADLIELSAGTARKTKDMFKKASTPTEPRP